MTTLECMAAGCSNAATHAVLKSVHDRDAIDWHGRAVPDGAVGMMAALCDECDPPSPEDAA